MYTIGQVSKMVGLPVSTLRYYDRQGLFPGMARVSGIRQFGESELEALRVIACLKQSGMEIRDIQQFMAWCAEGPSTFPQRQALFERQKARVEEEMLHMQKVLDLIKYKCWYYQQAQTAGDEAAVQAMVPNQLPPEIRAAYENAHRD